MDYKSKWIPRGVAIGVLEQVRQKDKDGDQREKTCLKLKFRQIVTTGKDNVWSLTMGASSPGWERRTPPPTPLEEKEIKIL